MNLAYINPRDPPAKQKRILARQNQIILSLERGENISDIVRAANLRDSNSLSCLFVLINSTHSPSRWAAINALPGL